MHHTTDRIAYTSAFVTPVVGHWLEREIAQWVHPMKDRSDNPSHHEWTFLPQSYISLPQWSELNILRFVCLPTTLEHIDINNHWSLDVTNISLLFLFFFFYSQETYYISPLALLIAARDLFPRREHLSTERTGHTAAFDVPVVGQWLRWDEQSENRSSEPCDTVDWAKYAF